MTGDKIYITVVLFIAIFLLTRHLIKAMGLFTYDTNEESEEYEEWLRTEGPKKKIFSIIAIASLLIIWIWSMINL